MITFEHANPEGISRVPLEAAMDGLQAAHISKFYSFPKPNDKKSKEWWVYELWLQYKKEISVWAD